MTEYKKNSPETIQAMFGSIAQQYDRTNAVLSFQMHRYWNNVLIKLTSQNAPPSLYADLCCGTGEIAFSYLKKVQEKKEAVLIDFCAEMLACAQHKAQNLALAHHSISYLEADVQRLPLEEASVSFATMAYGIRNVKDPKQCVKEVHRVLKKGGRFGILELTRPDNKMLRFAHHAYLVTVLPVLGKFLTSNRSAYEYLCQSIHTFIKPSELENLLREVGFVNVRRVPLSGGIATILLAEKA